MKFKNKLNLKSEKVLLGLFALLFVSSFATTGFILKQDKVANNANKNQLAQIGPDTPPFTTVGSSCLIIDSISGRRTNLQHVVDESNNIDDIQILNRNFFSVKNDCDFPIRLLSPNSLNTLVGQGGNSYYTGFSNHLVQTEDPDNYPRGAINITDFNVFPSFVKSNGEILVCDNCLTPNPGIFINNSYVPNNSTVASYELQPSETKQFHFFTSVRFPHDSSLYYDSVRMLPVNLKWFKTASVESDNYLSLNEIKTRTFSENEKNMFANDFIRMDELLGIDGMDLVGSEYKNTSIPADLYEYLESIKKIEEKNKVNSKTIENQKTRY